MVSNHKRDLELTILEKKAFCSDLNREYERLIDSKKKAEKKTEITLLCEEIKGLENRLEETKHERELSS